MLFNSIDFLLFFPVVTAVFFVIPKKLRYIWLLITSYYFYMGWNPKYALLIALSTVITFVCSLLLDHNRENITLKKWIVFACAFSNLGILAVFKYANFFLENLSRIMGMAGLQVIDKRLDLLLPVGISFYTFQALSYTFDVYNGKIRPEKNLLRYALFVSFFPQLVAGPIERSRNLLPQIQNIETIKVWNSDRVRDGSLLMMWGLFQKLFIADRAALIVRPVMAGYRNYGMLEIAAAAFFFAIQIYCDFGGYTNIARGAAKVLGFDLMNNFRQPYFAMNIKDFWRRWHISLTTWFTDYLYIPLGGNRKGNLRRYLNILIVFAVSGLWHGASWNFVIWGLLHAFFQIAGDLKNRILHIDPRTEQISTVRRILRILGTFVLVDFAWIFFVADNLTHALQVIGQMFTALTGNGFSAVGVPGYEYLLLFAGILLLLFVDYLHETGRSLTIIVNRWNPVLRMAVYAVFVFSIILLGIHGAAYDAGTFIYFQF